MLPPEESLSSVFTEDGVAYAVSGPCRSEDLSLWPLFFHWAWQGESFTGEHQISVSELLDAFHALGYDLEMRELWGSMKRLSQTRLEWVVVENQKKKAVGFCVLLASAVLEQDQAASVLTYTIPECLTRMIPDPEALVRVQGYLLEAFGDGTEGTQDGPEGFEDRPGESRDGAQDLEEGPGDG